MEEQDKYGHDSSKKRFDEGNKIYHEQTTANRDRLEENWNRDVYPQENQKVLAGILAIVLGGFGVHKFILGYTQEGIIQMVITIATCGLGSVIGLIEGIIYLTKSDEEFYRIYQAGKRGWF